MTAVGARRVLIVDDEDDIRALLRVLLADGSGRFEVIAEATDGHEALDRWRESRPDIVLLDQRMPGRSGLEVAEQILAEDPLQRIALFSAYLTETMREHATSLGIAACVPKEDVFAVPDVLEQLLT
jgi:two-component system chemotaxis response regulator CheY